MLNLSEFFQNQYQFVLKNISYTSYEQRPDTNNVTMKVEDDFLFKQIDKELIVTISRRVYFNPTAMFYLDISFEMVLYFKENIEHDVTTIDWQEELISSENPYLMNVMSRISKLIADITSSYGQEPLITPPVFMKKRV